VLFLAVLPTAHQLLGGHLQDRFGIGRKKGSFSEFGLDSHLNQLLSPLELRSVRLES
jgi:hypothetical protein